MKILLICLLMALLPVQGFAMTAAPACAGMPHRQVSVPASHAIAHCHMGMQDYQQPSHLHGCDGCAICHAVFAAVTDSTGFVPRLQVLRLQARTTSLLFYGHTPAVPERPPRLMIA